MGGGVWLVVILCWVCLFSDCYELWRSYICSKREVRREESQ